MRPGDLVEFKPGSHGIGAPHNYGIYLEREKRKGDFYIVLWTVKGRVAMSRDSLTSKKLSARVEGELDEATLTGRLQQLLEDLGKGKVREDVQFRGELRDRDLWRTVSGTTDTYSAETLAALHFKQGASGSQVEATRKALQACRPGVGYFRRAPGREERWVPLSVEEHKLFKQEAERFHVLRKKLVHQEEVLEEGHDEPRIAYRGVPLAEATLDDQDRARLAVVQRFMASFILQDRDTGEVTLPGTSTHTLDGFSLFDFCRWLSNDWLGGAVSGISSTFVEFLVELGLWTQQQALDMVAQRKVLGFPDFSWAAEPQAEKEANRFPSTFPPAWLERRWDLRQGHACYTIDPPDAKDFDDAVGVDFHADGSATLWVHIADVSHYVEKGSLLDRHARQRATSVYLPVRVLPMLPHRLSDDLCSLRAREDRLAMTAKLTYDASGVLVKEEFGEAVIRVAHNARYPEVDAAIAEQRAPFAAMQAFAQKLGTRRRGLSLESGERKILFGADGIVDPQLKHASPATRMIEVFMVAANEAVARELTRQGLTPPYRCHPLPDRASVERFNAQMATIGLEVAITLPERSEDDPGEEGTGGGGTSLLEQLQKGGKLELLSGGFRAGAADEDVEGEPAEPAVQPLLQGFAQLAEDEREAWLQPFRDVLGKVAGLTKEEERDLVQLKLLGCMGRAFYTPGNLGHFGLGSACYVHFTSPIRRYPDLVVHRMLRWVLRGKEGPTPHDAADLQDLSVHCSDQGSASESLERGVVNVAMVFASRTQPDLTRVLALVNGITKGGVFLGIKGGLEAKLLTSDIPGGPYAVDEFESMLFQGELERAPKQEVEGLSWRETTTPEGEVVRVALRLGDWVPVAVVGRDYIDGRVRVKLAGHLDTEHGVRL